MTEAELRAAVREGRQREETARFNKARRSWGRHWREAQKELDRRKGVSGAGSTEALLSPCCPGHAWSIPTAGAQDGDAARLFARSGIVAQLVRPRF